MLSNHPTTVRYLKVRSRFHSIIYLILTSSDHQSLPTPFPQPNTSTLSFNSTYSTSSKPKPSRIEKRESNTLAARRYRQRRVDQMKNLEMELEKIKRERDELRIRVSKLEGETEALRSLVPRK